MKELYKPFTVEHTKHSSTDPIEISFGMTFVDCQGPWHQAGIVTGWNEEEENGFSAAPLFLRDNDQGEKEILVSLSGTSWRECIVESGLSHVNPKLPDQMTPREVYDAHLKMIGPRYTEKIDFSYLLNSYEESNNKSPKMIRRIP